MMYLRLVAGAIRSRLMHRGAKRVNLEVRCVPPVLWIATTNTCTANCVFCGYQNNTDKKKHMSFDTFQKAADEYRSLGGTSLDFTTVSGDPLVDKNLFEKIVYARANGIQKIAFATNAVLLRQNYKKIIDSGVTSLVISSPGFDRDAYRRIYRVDKYDDVMDGIILLAEYKKEMSSDIVISVSMRLDRSLEEACRDEGFLKLKPYFDAELLRVEWSDCSNLFHNWAQLTQEDLLPGMKMIEDFPQKKKGYTCTAIVHSFSVLPSGDIRACACRYKYTEADRLVVGNIYDNTFISAVSGTRIVKLIEETSAGDWPECCVNCSMYQPYDTEALKR